MSDALASLATVPRWRPNPAKNRGLATADFSLEGQPREKPGVGE